MAAKFEKTYFDFDTLRVPVKIYREFRSSVRASIGKQAAILRMPALLPKKVQQERIQWFEDWVRHQLENNQRLLSRFQSKVYEDGQMLVVGDRSYRLKISTEDRKTHGAKLKGQEIILKLSKNEKGLALQTSIQTLLSRVVAKDFLPEIERKVDRINDQYFQREIKSVKLKHTHSRWGSCSHQGNINLSTRLLFAPSDVIDYVIIHELAHLVEFNHSERFWKIVENIMPDYKAKERWLKENSEKCHY